MQMHVQTPLAAPIRRMLTTVKRGAARYDGSGRNVAGERERRVWTFAEADYLFGSGALRIIIDTVDWSRPRVHDGQTWYDVHGTEVSSDGRVIGPRQTTVKATSLRPAR